MWTLEELETLAEQGFDALDTCLTPIDAALSHIPAIHLDEDRAKKLTMGQVVQTDDLPNGELFRLYQGEDRFLGLGKPTEDGQIAPKRLLLHG
jgi:tRNA pseudouridine55 synthase